MGVLFFSLFPYNNMIILFEKNCKNFMTSNFCRKLDVLRLKEFYRKTSLRKFSTMTNNQQQQHNQCGNNITKKFHFG